MTDMSCSQRSDERYPHSPGSEPMHPCGKCELRATKGEKKIVPFKAHCLTVSDMHLFILTILHIVDPIVTPVSSWVDQPKTPEYTQATRSFAQHTEERRIELIKHKSYKAPCPGVIASSRGSCGIHDSAPMADGTSDA